MDRDNMEALYPDELDMVHYRVFTSRGLLPDILPNINLARQLAFECIDNGGAAVIFKTVEMWQYNGNTLEQVELKEWP